MRQTELKLSEEDRSVVEGSRSKGWHQAREVNRAHVPRCLDRAIPEAQMMAVWSWRYSMWSVQVARAGTTPIPSRA